MKTLGPFEFYEEAEIRDVVRLHYADGSSSLAAIEGVMLRGGAEPIVDVISTRGTRFALREGDRVEFIARGGRDRSSY